MRNLRQLTLVTIAYNSGEVLPAHIDSLLSTLDGAAMPRWIIFDNDSGDGSRKMLAARYPGIDVLKSTTNVGFGAACNLGIQASDTPYVVVLNSDTQLLARALP
jgi:N-acetylglucosaminyl-diphospho-decaprenol L-rhamnosyltransferase